MFDTIPIAVVGMGGIFPGAFDLAAFWKNIVSRCNTVKEVPEGRWRAPASEMFHPKHLPDKAYSLRACFVDEFSVDMTGIDLPAELVDHLDPLYHMVLKAGRDAFFDCHTENIDKSHIGVALAAIALPTDSASALTREILGKSFENQLLGKTGFPSITREQCLAAKVTGFPAALLARGLNLGGVSFTLDAACASSLYAVKIACDELQSRRADAILAGGVSRPECLYTQVGFSQLRALSPSGRCAPFDAMADGLVVGEGAGIMVLKRLEDALDQGDRIYAVIRGIGLSNDMCGNLLAPDSEGQVRAMGKAYASAGWCPSDVDLIECHGAGTTVGDTVELKSLNELWSKEKFSAAQCPIGSIKSMIGHLLTGAGAAGMIKTLLAIHHEILPPSLNFEKPSKGSPLEFSPFRILREPVPWKRRGLSVPRRAGVSAFGFGGINAHILLEEYLPAALNCRQPVKAASKIKNNAGDIAIVGMSAAFGKIRSLRQFQEFVLNGKTAICVRPKKRWRGCDSLEGSFFDGRRIDGVFLKGVSIPVGKFRIPPNEISDILPQQLLMLEAASQALMDAGLPLRENRPEMGVVIGMNFDYEATNFHLRWNLVNEVKRWAAEANIELESPQLEKWMEKLKEKISPPLTAARTLGALGGIVASRIAKEMGLGGPSFVVSQEEAGGLRALEVGARLIQNGEVDTVIVGAVDLSGDIRKVLIDHYDRPWSKSGKISAFDRNSDGSLPGEGAVALILKHANRAKADGDRIYAVLKGIGGAGAGKNQMPDQATYERSLHNAFEDSGVDPNTISYLEAFGSGNSDYDAMEASALGDFFKNRTESHACAVGSMIPVIGQTGAAAGLAAAVKVCLSLYQEIIPPIPNYGEPGSYIWKQGKFHFPIFPQYWARNRKDGPRRACVGTITADGSCMHLILEDPDYANMDKLPDSLKEKICLERKSPLGTMTFGLFAVTGDNSDALTNQLESLENFVSKVEKNGEIHDKNISLGKCAQKWFHFQKPDMQKKMGVCIVAQDILRFKKGIREAKKAVENGTRMEINGRSIVSYSPKPMGKKDRVAFVFPGSGNHYLGMGRDIGITWPEIYREMDDETLELKSQLLPYCHVPWRVSWETDWQYAALEKIASDPTRMIFGQVVHGGVMSNLVQKFGITPSSVIGYSLGESAGLFALRAWPERGEMLARMRRTDLFTTQLAGPCEAAKKAWKISPKDTFHWQAVAVNRPSDIVEKVIKDISYLRLLIINTPEECVIGGRKESVSAAIEILGCKAVYLEGVVTVHCDAAEPVAEKYRNLHVFPVTPPLNVSFYSCGYAKAYELSTKSAADSILKQALSGFDFPQTIRRAHEDGVRIFLEMGPHASCTRMIRTILKDQPHLAISASLRGEPESLSILKFLSALIAQGVPINLEWLYGGKSFVNGIGIETDTPIDPQHQKPSQKWINVPIGGLFPNLILSEIYGKKSQIVDRRNTNTTALFSGLMDSLTKTTETNAEVHQKFLDFSNQSSKMCVNVFGFQAKLLAAMLQKGTDGAVFDGNKINLSNEISDKKRTDPESLNSWQDLSNHSHLMAPAFNRKMCLEFATGSVAKVLGPEFAEVDTYKARVRLPDEPLMLVDRIISVEGEKGSLKSGRVVTEHDVLPNAWYLDGGRAPVCISVEAGQADLFLCSYLGIDLAVKGERTYRLLDAVVEFHRGLPQPGDVIRYEIEIEKFVRHGDTFLFFFNFKGYIDNLLLITMRDGCAGFFTDEEIKNSGGIILKDEETSSICGKKSETHIPIVFFPSGSETYDEEKIEALRNGDLESCFGAQFRNIKPAESLWLPGGRMKLIHRVLTLDPKGGRYGMGMIRAEADIQPDDWFLTCHFMDDMVMPGTLMYECCAHSLRVLLQRMGWVSDKAGVCYEPVIGVKSRLKCRGPVTPKTRHVIYEVSLKKIGYFPEPYVIADALMRGDGQPIVRFEDMSMKITGLSIEEVKDFWARKKQTHPDSLSVQLKKKATFYGRDKILAFAAGKPSEAFGEPYRVFDHDRVIARLPRPPYSFMDRVTYIEPEPWVLKPGGWIEAEYDMPVDAWYYRADRNVSLPFCILLEIALQPCGWLAAYAGSALRSEKDLKFRNLGGTGMLSCEVFPENGPLTIRCRMKKVSEVGDMIIEDFDFELCQKGQIVYKGETNFGFFTAEALKQQVGIRNAEKQGYFSSVKKSLKSETIQLELNAPLFPEDPEGEIKQEKSLAMPAKALLMLDEIETYIPDGGPKGLGFIRGKKTVDPEEWFFKAHFYQDPVCPGSLGIESFIQLMKFAALKKWPQLMQTHRFGSATEFHHTWIYRGQIIPENKTVQVEGWVTGIRKAPIPTIFADGVLKVDGLNIYKMENFGITLQPVNQ